MEHRLDLQFLTYQEMLDQLFQPTSPVTNPDGYVLISYVQSSGANTVNVLLSQSITVDGAGTSYSANPSVTIAGNWYPMTLNGSDSNH
jgi:hypothetical protein